MSYQRFSLFPNSPSLKNLLSPRSLRYRWRSGEPVITTTIMTVCIAMWVVETLLETVWTNGLSALLNVGMLTPATALQRPWTFLTSMFLHQPSSLWHILFNMMTLWCIGPVLERMMGHLPYLVLYALSGVAGGTGMMVWSAFVPQGWTTAEYGASGSLFGLFAAVLVAYRRTGTDIRSMVIWMIINFLLPVIIPNIAWQAHLGGFAAGGSFAWLLTSRLRILRGKSLKWCTTVCGIALLGAIVAIALLSNTANPWQYLPF